MPWDYPDTRDNGKEVMAFHSHMWTGENGNKISAERFSVACAMGYKQAGQSEIHRVACAIIYENKVYFGISNHGKENDIPLKLEAAMRQRSGANHSRTNCAEIRAMIDVCNAGYNADHSGSGLEVYSCLTASGEPKEMCPNCLMLLGLSSCKSNEDL